jgi:acyl-CoA synthetase (AMP-forming)/AMP-acid ligase II
MVTHKNLVHSLTAQAKSTELTEQSVLLVWAPHYHDLGLIGNYLACAYIGCTLHVISPMLLLKDPALWLRLLDKHKASEISVCITTHCSIICNGYTDKESQVPNFALALTARKVPPKDRVGLDLSRVKWFIGAEPVRYRTVTTFVKEFASCGVTLDKMRPSFGMAENVLIVSIFSEMLKFFNKLLNLLSLNDNKATQTPYRHATIDSAAFEKGKIVYVEDVDNDRAMRISSCGTTIAGLELIVVNPETFVQLPDSEIGEIWMSGPTKTAGYWKKPEINEKSFHARLANGGSGNMGDGYLRTGDMAFMKDGHIYLCGRLKDLIIIGGRNYYPQDIEQVAEDADSRLRPGCIIVFSVEVKYANLLFSLADYFI